MVCAIAQLPDILGMVICRLLLPSPPSPNGLIWMMYSSSTGRESSTDVVLVSMTSGLLCLLRLYSTLGDVKQVRRYILQASHDSCDIGNAWVRSVVSYFVSSNFWFILKSFDMLPVQDDLGIWCIPHDFQRCLARGYSTVPREKMFSVLMFTTWVVIT